MIKPSSKSIGVIVGRLTMDALATLPAGSGAGSTHIHVNIRVTP